MSKVHIMELASERNRQDAGNQKGIETELQGPQVIQKRDIPTHTQKKVITTGSKVVQSGRSIYCCRVCETVQYGRSQDVI